MLISTFGPSTAWCGKTITFENDGFVLQGHEPISASDVLRYDREGHLVWVDDWTRAWVAAKTQAMSGRPARSSVASILAQRRLVSAWQVLAWNAGCFAAAGACALLALIAADEVSRWAFALVTLFFLAPAGATLLSRPVGAPALRRWLKATALGDFGWACFLACCSWKGFSNWSSADHPRVLACASFAVALAVFGVVSVRGVLAIRRSIKTGLEKQAPRRRHHSVAVVGVVMALVVGAALVPAGHKGTAGDGNWAGYVAGGQQFTSVTATWTQPAVRTTSISAKPIDVDIWVGLDGGVRGSDTVEQTGSTYGAGCNDQGAGCYAWYETYPRPWVTIARAQMAGLGSQHMAVFAGDTVTATVTSLGDQRFRFTLADDTLGESFSTVKTSPAAKCECAEIIVEAHLQNGVGLPDFGPVHFTNCLVDGRPIGSFDGYRTDITSDHGHFMTAASTVADDGTSFTVTRR